MGQYSTEALILGIRNWGEADKIITLLSPQQGLIKAAAFGCRRTKSALAGSLQMFNQVEIQLKQGDKLIYSGSIGYYKQDSQYKVGQWHQGMDLPW